MLDIFFNKNKGIRRLVVVWACVLISCISYAVFKDISKISMMIVSALGTMTALLGVPIGYYFHNRGRDDCSDKDEEK